MSEPQTKEFAGFIWGEWYRNKKTGQPYRHVPLHAGQQAIWDSEARFLAYTTGKGSGKSAFAPVWLDREVRKNPKGLFILAAPSVKILRQGVLPQFLKHFDSSDLKGNFGKQDGEYTLPTGGKVFIRSLDDPESINGIHAHAIVVDEAANCPLATWTIIESRVSQTLGRVLLTSTPYRRYRWLESEIIARFRGGDADYFAFQGASTINPAFSEKEFERLRRTKSDHIFRRDYCGEFTTPEGTALPGLLNCVVDMPAAGLPSGRYYGSHDFGGTDPNATLVGVLDHNDCYWLFYERYIPGEDFLQTAKGIRQWHNAFHVATGSSVEKWWCDSHRPDAIKALRRYRLDSNDHGPTLNARPVKKVEGSIEHGLELINARIRTGRLKIIRGAVKALCQESDEYCYETNENGDGTGQLVGRHHAVDSLRYALLGIDRRKNTYG